MTNLTIIIGIIIIIKQYNDTSSVPSTVAANAAIGINDGAMEMLYYLPCTLDVSFCINSNNENTGQNDITTKSSTSSFSSQITDLLAQKKINYVNIAFAVISDVIVFDRNRDGLLYRNEDDFWLTVFNESNNTSTTKDPTATTEVLILPANVAISTSYTNTRKNRNNSFDYSMKTTNNKDNDDNINNNGLIRDLPGAILEHILTYVPDYCVGSASCVCKSWNYEIGKNSSNLWQHLLQRRNWPIVLPVIQQTQEEAIAVAVAVAVPTRIELTSNRQQQQYHSTIHRDTFIRHYTAVRDMVAIRYGCCNGLLQSSNTISSSRRHQRNRCIEREMTYHDFATRKFSPKYPNSCVSVQVWSKNRILAAYKNDCSVRLFEADERLGSYTNELTCREIVCQKIDPYRNTKKRTCTFVAMGLDDECIGCLAQVVSDNIQKHVSAYILIIMRRENFLVGESSSCGGEKDPSANTPDFDTSVNVIDIGEAVINFLLSTDHVDQRLLAIIDFISDGGALGEVEVLTSHSIASCGYGRFMVEVAIYLPSIINDDDADDEDDDNDDDTAENSRMRFIDRRLILFSTRLGAIVWMGDSNPLSHTVLRPYNECTILSSYRRCSINGGTHTTCYIAASSTLTSSIALYELDYSGTFHIVSPSIKDISCMVRNEIDSNGWAIAANQLMLLTPTDVIVTFVANGQEHGRIVNRSILAFYPLNPTREKPSYTIIPLAYGIEVKSLSCIRDDHISLLCRVESSVTSIATPPEPLDRNLNVIVDDDENDEDDDVESHDNEQEDDDENDSNSDSDNDDNVGVVNGQQDFINLANVDNMPEEPHSTRTSFVSIIYHIPTRKEISQIDIVNEFQFNEHYIPILPSHWDETVGAALSWKGVVMTGADVRSVRQSTPTHGTQQQQQQHNIAGRANSNKNNNTSSYLHGTNGTNSSASKKQQQQQQQKKTGKKKNSGKKDGFARGMSLRG
jgi:F-box domain